MTLYKNKYRVESARLKGWDYSSPGHYFITICTKNRECLFGNVVRGEIVLSETGKIAEQYWREIPVHFNGIELDEFVVMPNHIHGIISIAVETPNLGVSTIPDGTTIPDTPTIPGGTTIPDTPTIPGGTTIPGVSPTGIKNPPNIGIVINQFKRICTIRIRESNPGISIWQPRFHDHIIRDENELNRIRQYIIDNPANWRKDDNYITGCR